MEFFSSVFDRKDEVGALFHLSDFVSCKLSVSPLILALRREFIELPLLLPALFVTELLCSWWNLVGLLLGFSSKPSWVLDSGRPLEVGSLLLFSTQYGGLSQNLSRLC